MTTLTTTTHAPGPWIVGDEDSPLLLSGDGTYVAQVISRDEKGTLRPGYAADAKLIAAAPDLLAALEAADRWVAMYHDLPGHDAASRCMTAVIRAAIAKATA